MGKPVKAVDLFNTLNNDLGYRKAREALRLSMTLANNVFRLRAAKGLSQAELAERAQMKQPRIADIEGAHGNPRLQTIAKIAAALHTDAAALLRDGDRQMVHVVEFHEARVALWGSSSANRVTMVPWSSGSPRMLLGTAEEVTGFLDN